MSKFILLTTTSKQISTQSPQTSIDISSKHRATQTTPKKPSHSASSSESAVYVLPTLSLTNEAENSSSTLPNVVIAAPHYKEMRIAFAQFHVTQPFNRKNRNPPRLSPGGGGGTPYNREFKQIATAGPDTAAGSKFPQK